MVGGDEALLDPEPPASRAPRRAARRRRPAPARPGSGHSIPGGGRSRCRATPGGVRTSRRGPRRLEAGRGEAPPAPAVCFRASPDCPSATSLCAAPAGRPAPYDVRVALGNDGAVGGGINRSRRGRGRDRRPSGLAREPLRGRCPAGQPVRVRLADQAAGRRRLHGRRRGGGGRPGHAGGRHLEAYRRPGRASITARHLLSHASGLPETGPPGVASLDVEPVRPPGTRRIYSNEGYAVLGELLSAATACRSAATSGVGVRPAWHGRVPRAARIRVRQSARRARARPLPAGGRALQLRQWRQRGDRRRRGVCDRRRIRPQFVAVLLSRGDPLLALETFGRDGARSSSLASPAGSSRSRPGTSPTGRSAVTFATGSEPHWTLGRLLAVDAVALRRRRHGDVGRPGRARRPGVPGQPRHVLGLADAAGRLAGPLGCVVREAA